MPGVDLLAQAFNGGNAAFVADMYARWAANPSSVDASFAELFAALNDEARGILMDATGASWSPQHFDIAEAEPAKPVGKAGKAAPAAIPATAGATPEQVRATALDSLRALMMIRAYRVRGHLEARLDPLGLQVPKSHAELDPGTYGFGPGDLDRPIFIDNVLGRESATVREIIAILRASYCGPIGVEFMHIQDPEQKTWIQRRIENAPWTQGFDLATKRTILTQLTEAEGFETFCQKRYVGTKRFGLEGGEVTIPALHAMIEVAARAGVAEIAIGMPHRGRLNTLVNIVRKPFTSIFSEFGGNSAQPDDVQGSGDVKYHLGTSTDVEVAGHSVHISLQPNPSHLEAVDPVVVGKVRARQDMAGDTKARRTVMGILMHGDAAFAGQGLVYETLAMSQLIGYRTGGTIHLIVNNQIGFTTVPAHAYSGLYCTDVSPNRCSARSCHVNGDDPEAVIFCARPRGRVPPEFRDRLRASTSSCYRRHGHNETDEPAFTQPHHVSGNPGAADDPQLCMPSELVIAEDSVPAEEARAIWDGFQEHAGGRLQGGADLQTEPRRLAGRTLGWAVAVRTARRTA